MRRGENITRATRAEGFTILELTVVMGLLAVFMMFLLQVVFRTTEVFQTGQVAQERSAYSLASVRPVEETIRSTLGPTFEDKNQASDARLIVQWVASGFDPKGTFGDIQVLRSTVSVLKHVEKNLLAARFRAAAEETIGDDPERVEQAVQQLLSGSSFQGRGEMMLIAWPEGDEEGAFFDLRRALFLPDQSLPFRSADGRSLLGLRDLATEFSAQRVVPNSTVLATGLLHLSYRLASQYTRNWIDGPDGQGPEQVWDSVRAGWLVDGQIATRKFTLDLGEISRTDSTDDVYPHYIEATVVSGGSSQELPDAHLSLDIGSSTRNIELINTDRLPNLIHDNFLKIGSEWIQFSSLRRRTLMGCKRGLRGTVPKSHDRRTGVRAGKTAVLMIKIPHARDSWNE